jgi:hypothetical protein
MRTSQACRYRVGISVALDKASYETTAQAVADFGKAVTVLHTLIHKSVPLTNVQREFIKTELHTLEVAMKIHYPKRPGQG